MHEKNMREDEKSSRAGLPKNGLAVGAALDAHGLQIRMCQVLQINATHAVLNSELPGVLRYSSHTLRKTGPNLDKPQLPNQVLTCTMSWCRIQPCTCALVHSAGCVRARYGRRRW